MCVPVGASGPLKAATWPMTMSPAVASTPVAQNEEDDSQHGAQQADLFHDRSLLRRLSQLSLELGVADVDGLVACWKSAPAVG
jgi:hypothetical protein